MAFESPGVTDSDAPAKVARKGARAEDYAPGDLVTWDLGGNVPHIGIVVDKTPAWNGHHLIVHNIGQGPKMEDVMFNWKITGHYRYFGPAVTRQDR